VRDFEGLRERCRIMGMLIAVDGIIVDFDVREWFLERTKANVAQHEREMRTQPSWQKARIDEYRPR
jgi:hypothetical protein